MTWIMPGGLDALFMAVGMSMPIANNVIVVGHIMLCSHYHVHVIDG